MSWRHIKISKFMKTIFFSTEISKRFYERHDIQENDIQYNDTQQNNTRDI